MPATDHDSPIRLAKLVWNDPQNGQMRDYVLTEGATATLGRLAENDICIRERHVSRQHAVISYRDGIFTINDLGSANGTYVNDKRLYGLFPLTSGDRIRLFVPALVFCAIVDREETHQSQVSESPVTASNATPQNVHRLLITAGAQEGHVIRLNKERMTIGRTAAGMQWDICLHDPAVSRTHARLEFGPDHRWRLFDLGSSNGTLVNGVMVDVTGHTLADGDVITFGGTTVLFRDR